MSDEIWQVLDVGSIWMREFASAMAKTSRTVAWWPEMRKFGALEGWERVEAIAEPVLEVHRFPLQRGYARTPLRQMLPFEVPLLKRLRAAAGGEEQRSPLVLSTPFYAPVAERWGGPSIYYVTDLTAGYEGMNRAQVVALDKRMCRSAKAICPNSRRLANYLIEEAGCPPEKITVVPNATRESNIAMAPLLEPGPLPEAVISLPRPIAGVIGNLSANMDWELLEAVVAATPWLTWVFVGPTTMPIAETAQAAARERVMAGRAHFVGGKPYGELQAYARCFDVAVLPYRKKEPTYSGSSTRFYEHVAACRPMVATRGFAELLEKPPLLVLADTPDETVAALDGLRAVGFHDGQEQARWEHSRTGTWEERVRALTETV